MVESCHTEYNVSIMSLVIVESYRQRVQCNNRVPNNILVMNLVIVDLIVKGYLLSVITQVRQLIVTGCLLSVVITQVRQLIVTGYNVSIIAWLQQSLLLVNRASSEGAAGVLLANKNLCKRIIQTSSEVSGGCIIYFIFLCFFFAGCHMSGGCTIQL